MVDRTGSKRCTTGDLLYDAAPGAPLACLHQGKEDPAWVGIAPHRKPDRERARVEWGASRTIKQRAGEWSGG